MDVDWGYALQLGGVGFGTVFLVLVILAIVMWVTGLVLKRLESGEVEAGEKKKGA